MELIQMNTLVVPQHLHYHILKLLIEYFLCVESRIREPNK